MHSFACAQRFLFPYNAIPEVSLLTLSNFLRINTYLRTTWEEALITESATRLFTPDRKKDFTVRENLCKLEISLKGI